jgi:hypothetical protein
VAALEKLLQLEDRAVSDGEQQERTRDIDNASGSMSPLVEKGTSIPLSDPGQ